jgi:hypothetical protein
MLLPASIRFRRQADQKNSYKDLVVSFPFLVSYDDDGMFEANTILPGVRAHLYPSNGVVSR